jgi:hypothetical protein
MLQNTLSLSELSRDTLIKLFGAAIEDLQNYSRITASIEAKEAEKKAYVEKANRTINRHPNIFWFFLIGTGALLLLVLKNADNISLRALIVAMISWLVLIVVCLPFERKHKKRIQREENNLSVAMQQYDTLLVSMKQQREAVIDNFKALQFIPDKYCSERALKGMLEDLQVEVASTWKECVERHELRSHRDNLEALAQETARHARISADLQRETRDAARWAAAGSWATAAGVWRNS